MYQTIGIDSTWILQRAPLQPRVECNSILREIHSILLWMKRIYLNMHHMENSTMKAVLTFLIFYLTSKTRLKLFSSSSCCGFQNDNIKISTFPTHFIGCGFATGIQQLIFINLHSKVNKYRIVKKSTLLILPSLSPKSLDLNRKRIYFL